MSDVIIVAIISFVGTLVGTFAGIVTSSKLTNYRIEQLEKKVEKWSDVAQRVALAEQSIKSAHHRIDIIKGGIKSEKRFQRNYIKDNCNADSPN